MLWLSGRIIAQIEQGSKFKPSTSNTITCPKLKTLRVRDDYIEQ